jgi:hypothetical protein
MKGEGAVCPSTACFPNTKLKRMVLTTHSAGYSKHAPRRCCCSSKIACRTASKKGAQLNAMQTRSQECRSSRRLYECGQPSGSATWAATREDTKCLAPRYLPQWGAWVSFPQPCAKTSLSQATHMRHQHEHRKDKADSRTQDRTSIHQKTCPRRRSRTQSR